MESAATPTRTPMQTLLHNFKLFLPAAALFVALLAFNFWPSISAVFTRLNGPDVPLSPGIEERFGIRFTGLHVLAREGLIDLRYRVIDAGKAKNFGHYTETSPLLIGRGGKTVEVTIMGMHNHRVEAGRIYYILYRNTGNAIKSGDRVTLQIDDMKIENILAK